MHHCMQSMPVYLFPELVVVMRRQKARVAEARLRSAHWEDHDLAFPTSIGTPCDPHNVRRVLKPLALSARFPGGVQGPAALVRLDRDDDVAGGDRRCEEPPGEQAREHEVPACRSDEAPVCVGHVSLRPSPCPVQGAADGATVVEADS